MSASKELTLQKGDRVIAYGELPGTVVKVRRVSKKWDWQPDPPSATVKLDKDGQNHEVIFSNLRLENHTTLQRLTAEARSMTFADRNRALKQAFKDAGLLVKKFQRGQGHDNFNFVWVDFDMAPGETPAEQEALLTRIKATATAVEPDVVIRSKFLKMTSAEYARAKKDLGL